MFASLKRRLKRGSVDDDEDSEFEGEIRGRVAKKLHSRRPPNTAFRQQRLKSWQPVLTARIVIPLLLLVAIISIPIGIGIFLATYKVQMVSINYSKCDTVGSEYVEIPKKKYQYHFNSNNKSKSKWKYDEENKQCVIELDIPNDIKSNLFMYYKLTNFYQNHRKYVESYDWNQLRGEAVPWSDISSKCDPLRYRDDKIIYPAGLVANSLFNDTISTTLVNSDDNNLNFEFSDKGIAWKSDLSIYKTSEYNITDIVPPINWIEKYPNGYTEDDLVEIAQNEHFMNWMKTAALPTFMKLYGKNTVKGHKLQKGSYTLSIGMNYPVTVFGGTKSVVITTSSVVGGRHLGLSICYLVAGGLCVIFTLLFLIKQVATRNQRREHAFLDTLDNLDNANTESHVREML